MCGKCNEKLSLDQNWVDLPETGTLKNYTITPYKVADRRTRTVKDPQLIAMVQIDGTNTAIVNRLLNITPEEIKTGIKVKIEWSDKTTGGPSDINGFVRV
jgi:uncharacterized OB-fold protein